jgi:hypothetical protein
MENGRKWMENGKNLPKIDKNAEKSSDIREISTIIGEKRPLEPKNREKTASKPRASAGSSLSAFAKGLPHAVPPCWQSFFQRPPHSFLQIPMPDSDAWLVHFALRVSRLFCNNSSLLCPSRVHPVKGTFLEFKNESGEDFSRPWFGEVSFRFSLFSQGNPSHHDLIRKRGS